MTDRWRDTYDSWKLRCPDDDWDEEPEEPEEEELSPDILYEEWIEHARLTAEDGA